MLSIIIPFYNEKESLPKLLNKLIDVTKKLKEEAEIILVDDGSDDNSEFKSSSFAEASPPAYASGDRSEDKQISKYLVSDAIRLITHRKRFGKGRALLSGFRKAKGDIIVFMDADLQDDPKDLPKFLQKMKKGYDFVNGWRKSRNDPASKTLPSAIFNFLLVLFFGSSFHDINCGFKMMRRSVLEEIPLYGDNYRFLPILAKKEGFSTDEVEVTHHSRIYGKSKYGSVRLLFGLFDTLTTYFIYKFSEKPLHFFGPVGGFVFLIGFITSFILVIQRIFMGILLYRRPALLFAVLMIIVGMQIVMTGIIGELIVYLHRKNKA